MPMPSDNFGCTFWAVCFRSSQQESPVEMSRTTTKQSHRPPFHATAIDAVKWAANNFDINRSPGRYRYFLPYCFVHWLLTQEQRTSIFIYLFYFLSSQWQPFYNPSLLKSQYERGLTHECMNDVKVCLAAHEASPDKNVACWFTVLGFVWWVPVGIQCHLTWNKVPLTDQVHKQSVFLQPQKSKLFQPEPQMDK